MKTIWYDEVVNLMKHTADRLHTRPAKSLQKEEIVLTQLNNILLQIPEKSRRS